MKCSPLQAMFYLDWVDVCIGMLVLFGLLLIFRDLESVADESNLDDEIFQIKKNLGVCTSLVIFLCIYHVTR